MTAGIAAPPEVRPHRRAARKLGIVLHSPRLYDLTVRIFLLGRERSFRERLLALAALRAGEQVIDIGCGTGTTAILAKRQVGPAGAVCGIDASTQMIARAHRKASRAGVKVEFREAPAQALPFPDSQFDVAVSTLMLHHLTPAARVELAAEAYRVLRPGGRFLLIDFEKGPARKSRWRVPHRHGSVEASEIAEVLARAGFVIGDSGPVGLKDLTFALGTRR